MAEAHPVGFQWVMEAKRRGAKVIHVDPRFTRTSAVADLHVPIRAGLGHRVPRWPGQPRAEQRPGLPRVRRRLHERCEPHRRRPSRDTEDLDGLFSGFDPDTGLYDPTTWRYQPPEDMDEDEQQREEELEGDEAPGADQRASHQAARSESHGSGGAPVVVEGTPGRDAAGPALRVPDPEAALRALHPGDGAGGVRHRARAVPAGRRRAHQQQRARADRRLLLRGRVDASHRRRTDDPHGGDPADAARQHRSPGRRDHGAARPREHPGLDRHPDPVQHPARLPADAARRRSTSRWTSGSWTTRARPGSGATCAPTR